MLPRCDCKCIVLPGRVLSLSPGTDKGAGDYEEFYVRFYRAVPTLPCVLFSFPLLRSQPYVVCSDFIYVSSYHCRAYPQDIHLHRTVKLFRPSRFLGTMASADFSQFVVTTDRAPSVRPHGISPEPFPVYSPDLRIEVTVAFGTLMP